LPSCPGTGLIPSPSSGAPACTPCKLEILIDLCGCGELARVVRVDGVGDEARSDDALEKFESVASEARASSSSSRNDGTGEDARERERSVWASELSAAGFMKRWRISGSEAWSRPWANAIRFAAAAARQDDQVSQS